MMLCPATSPHLDDWVDEIEQRTGQKEKISKAQIWDALINTIDSINLNPSKRTILYNGVCFIILHHG